MFLWCEQSGVWLARSEASVVRACSSSVWNCIFPEHTLVNVWPRWFDSGLLLASFGDQRQKQGFTWLVEAVNYIPSLEAWTHSRLLSNLSPWSWVGSCVQLRLMKASHLEDKCQNEGPASLLSKEPQWPLFGEEAALSASTQAPFNLPLLCKLLVIQGPPFFMAKFFLSPWGGDIEDQTME